MSDEKTNPQANETPRTTKLLKLIIDAFKSAMTVEDLRTFIIAETDNEMEQLERETIALRKQVEELSKDKERLNFLIEQAVAENPNVWQQGMMEIFLVVHHKYAESELDIFQTKIRTAIDTAREQGRKESDVE